MRVVEMVGVDTNMCCGTHVSNLSHIQAVKLLHTESKHGSTLLYFVSGSRVCNLLEKCYQNERALTKMLRYYVVLHRLSSRISVCCSCCKFACDEKDVLLRAYILAWFSCSLFYLTTIRWSCIVYVARRSATHRIV